MKTSTDNAIYQSRKLAELMNSVGIEYYWKPEYAGMHLAENLIVLMDAALKLKIDFMIITEINMVVIDGDDEYSVVNNNWQSALCAALVEAIFKKLGEME